MYYVYILSGAHNNVLYTGVTNALIRRIYEHKNDINNGFTKHYQVHKLVYFECFDRVEDAIAREKQVKKYSRKKKVEMIGRENASWDDLYETLL